MIRRSSSAEGDFWRWFVLNEDRLFALAEAADPLMRELAERLQSCHEDLTFELSSPREGRREFAVSAGGIRDAFPAARALADSAPSLPRWTVFFLRQRKMLPVACMVNGATIDTASVQFHLAPQRDKIHVSLFLPGYSAHERATFATIGFLLLDASLGEYDVETKVGRVDFLPIAEAGTIPTRPIAELPAAFDMMMTELRSPSARR